MGTVNSEVPCVQVQVSVGFIWTHSCTEIGRSIQDGNDVTWPQPACLPSARKLGLGVGKCLIQTQMNPSAGSEACPKCIFPWAYFSSVVFPTSFLENKTSN